MLCTFRRLVMRIKYAYFSPLILLLLVLFLMYIAAVLIDYCDRLDMRFCYKDHYYLPNNGKAQPLGDVLWTEPRPSSNGGSIFFHETSCHEPALKLNIFSQQSQLNLVQLTARAACAIESAALHNPNLSVFVLFASPAYMDNSTAQPLLNAVLSYGNVHFRYVNLWRYAAGTLIQKWLEKGDLFKSKHLISHTSDFLRYLTMWRWGGTYLDTDVVVLRSLEDIAPNYVGAESSTYLAAGVMNFAHSGVGHKIAEQCLRDFRDNFDGQDWGRNGPGVILRVLKTICGVETAQEMVKRKYCDGFRVFGSGAFYAIQFKDWRHFFEEQYLKSTMERTKISYVAHVWNKLSKGESIKVGANVAYGKMAEEHCPRVYKAAGEYF